MRSRHWPADVPKSLPIFFFFSKRCSYKDSRLVSNKSSSLNLFPASPSRATSDPPPPPPPDDKDKTLDPKECNYPLTLTDEDRPCPSAAASCRTKRETDNRKQGHRVVYFHINSPEKLHFPSQIFATVQPDYKLPSASAC